MAKRLALEEGLLVIIIYAQSSNVKEVLFIFSFPLQTAT